MRYTDYSPPTTAATEVQADALRKGLGRCALWASTGQLEHEVLLDACLEDQRFDKQCEENRGEWLWKLMGMLGVIDAFRQPILTALANCTSEYNGYQLCEIIYHYAVSGDEAALNALWRFVEHQQIPDAQWVGVGQLMRLSGSKAFRRVVQLRGATLKTKQWDWYDDGLIDHANECLGKELVNSMLLDMKSDADSQAFATAWQRQQQKQDAHPAGGRVRCYDSISIEDVIEAVHSSDYCRWLRRWGRDATAGDLAKVLSLLKEADEPEIIVKLLQVFAKTELPEFDPYLITLCQSENCDIRQHAFRALANNRNEAIHVFAVEQLVEGDKLLAAQLLVQNFRMGDEKTMLDAFDISSSRNEKHWILMDILDVLEANEEADPSELGLVAYFHTPCEICRRSATKLLLARDVAPDWLIEEVANDSSVDARQLVGCE